MVHGHFPKRLGLIRYIIAVSYTHLVQSFDEELWYSTVDYVTVYEDKRLVFTFRDGRQVEITAELWRAA